VLDAPLQPYSAPLIPAACRAGLRGGVGPGKLQAHTVLPGETPWSIANTHGVGLSELRAVNKGNAAVAADALAAGSTVWLPPTCTAPAGALRKTLQLFWLAPLLSCALCDALNVFATPRVCLRAVLAAGCARCELHRGASSLQWHADTGEARRQQIITAVGNSNVSRDGPAGGVVAVKVQYPDALPLFTKDLVNLRGLAGFLSKTEVAFDLVSAVDELSSQVKFEFDFQRCAAALRVRGGGLPLHECGHCGGSLDLERCD
jgi:ABC1 atypical kinase-like domain/LysM domain